MTIHPTYQDVQISSIKVDKAEKSRLLRIFTSLVAFGNPWHCPSRCCRPNYRIEYIFQSSLFKSITTCTTVTIGKRYCSDIMQVGTDIFSIIFWCNDSFSSTSAHETRLAGPIQYRWMYPIERFLKKLKDYVCNKACPEGSIV